MCLVYELDNWSVNPSNDFTIKNIFSVQVN